MQGHYHTGKQYSQATYAVGSLFGFNANSTPNTTIPGSILEPITDGTNGTPRTGPKTEMESGTLLAYMFVGSYAD